MTRRSHTRLVAIVGRPNVGKSTLFNRIIRQRKSLVHDQPGVTRDRIFARAQYDNMNFFLCDTGGFEPHSHDNIRQQLVEQAELAIEEADSIIFVVDAQEGLHPVDEELVRRLRKAGKSFLIAVNKCDLPQHDVAVPEFRRLGVDRLFPVSAEHNRGIDDLLDEALKPLAALPAMEYPEDVVRLAIIGRPNVGKSSILNRIVGETRSIVDPRPGTTRDAVDVFLKYHGRELCVIDTAGIRRKSRMADKLEAFSVFRAMAVVEECDVAVLVIDAEQGPTEGDARVAGYAYELRKPILIVVNKWDLVPEKQTNTAKHYDEEVHRALRYIPYAPVVFVSAKENQRVSKIVPMCLSLFDEGAKRVSTGQVNRALREILVQHTPPLRKNKSRRIKFYYATQVTQSPPRFVVFCSDPDEIHFSYKRFVENAFREKFGFPNIPIKVFFRSRSRVDLDELLTRAKVKTQSRAVGDLPDLLDLEEIPDDETTGEETAVSFDDLEFDDDDDFAEDGDEE